MGWRVSLQDFPTEFAEYSCPTHPAEEENSSPNGVAQTSLTTIFREISFSTSNEGRCLANFHWERQRLP